MVRRQALRNKLRALSWVFCLFLISISLPVEAKVFNAESFTLDNGLQVVIIPNHRAPVVTHMVWYKVGAADEQPGMSGMAHYFEHLMFKGTKTQAPGEFSKIVKKLGGEDNAFTSQDYTAYFQTIPKEHLEKMMQLEADRMVNLDVPAEHFTSEKNVVIEERRQRTENDPRNLFYEQMQSAIFVNHPYGTPTIGWLSEIEKYEWQDVKKFYDLWYAPNNAIVVISGDVTLDQVKPLAEKTYGALPKKEIPSRNRPEIPPSIANTLMTLHHPSIHQPVFQQAFIAPSFRQSKQDSLALQVLEEIMDGGPTTRLYKNLVVDKKIAIQVSMSYADAQLDESTIWLSATPAPGISLETVEENLHKEILNVIENGVTETELKEAIQRLQDSAIYARDSLKGPAMIFGQTLTTGGSIEDIESWPENIAQITAEQIKQVAGKYLSLSNPWRRAPVTGHLLPPVTPKNQTEVTP